MIDLLPLRHVLVHEKYERTTTAVRIERRPVICVEWLVTMNHLMIGFVTNGRASCGRHSQAMLPHTPSVQPPTKTQPFNTYLRPKRSVSAKQASSTK